MENENNILGNNIRREREKRGLSLIDVAEVIGVTANYIGLVERGRRGIMPPKLIILAESFEITIDELLRGTPQEEETDPDGIGGRRAALKTLAYNLDENQLNFVITIIKELKKGVAF
ncbi:hypothetical protein AGMMS49975_09100 [Clostridia bacterium]|nr:hypothetical protein AGMMS49975_09100 [Clostridia bacterium]